MTIYGQLEGRKDLSIAQKKGLAPVPEEPVIDVDASDVGSDIYSKKWGKIWLLCAFLLTWNLSFTIIFFILDVTIFEQEVNFDLVLRYG